MKALKKISIFLAITAIFTSTFTFFANADDVVPEEKVMLGVNNTSATLLGDVNGDGSINSLDVTQIRRYIAGGYDVTVDTEVADINNDGIVNSLDVTLVRRYIAGGYPDADKYWEVEEDYDDDDGWTEGIYRP